MLPDELIELVLSFLVVCEECNKCTFDECINKCCKCTFTDCVECTSTNQIDKCDECGSTYCTNCTEFFIDTNNNTVYCEDCNILEPCNSCEILVDPEICHHCDYCSYFCCEYCQDSLTRCKCGYKYYCDMCSMNF